MTSCSFPLQSTQTLLTCIADHKAAGPSIKQLLIQQSKILYPNAWPFCSLSLNHDLGDSRGPWHWYPLHASSIRWKLVELAITKACGPIKARRQCFEHPVRGQWQDGYN